MRRLHLFACGLSSIAVAALASLAAPTVARADDTLVSVAAERLFIPRGFDDNDSAQIVADGVFSSGCYKLAKGEFDVDLVTQRISLRVMARLSDSPCIQVVVPYTYVFELGVLPKGEYDVVVEGTDVTGKLNIAESTNAGPDDEMYAAIDNAYVMELPSLGKRQIMLEGVYTNTCMRWVRTEVKHIARDVLEVLPIVRIEPADGCQDLRFPFKGIAVDVPGLEKGRYLLHVRAMNGAAVNRVFEVAPTPAR
jgi:hypothetical protein